MKTNAPRTRTLPLPFHSIRKITSPEDMANGRTIYVGQMPISAVVDLPTDENVRDYLLEAEGRVRRRPTQVHKAIRDTLENNPTNFSVLNSGIVIVSRGCEIDEKHNRVLLTDASIINGSQTQGVIRDFLHETEDAENVPAHVKFELIVTDNEELIGEISIARNFQNDVMTISIAGRLGQLDELEKRLQKHDPEAKLQKSETKLSDDYVRTEKLLQVIAALVPESLWQKGEFNKVYTYSMKTKCLKEFQEIHRISHDRTHEKHAEFKELYNFYLDIAPAALELYDKWKSHQGFRGTGLRSIERDGRNIIEVPDGIVFPILSSLSAFARKTKSGWKIEPPKDFDETELINSAKRVYQDIAQHNPWNMGKSKACYSSLYQITSIYRKLFG